MMSFIVFYVDLRLILQNQYYQTIHGSWDWTWVVKLMADIFSTFLGYRYLDDPRAILYNYPQPIWIFSLVCFFYGLKVLEPLWDKFELKSTKFSELVQLAIDADTDDKENEISVLPIEINFSKADGNKFKSFLKEKIND